MHGRVKERTTEEKRALIAKQHAIKVKLYQEGIQSIFTQRKLGECDDNTLKLIVKLVGNNPDINTLWNIRKEVLLSNGEDGKINQDRVEGELRLTEECLRVNPKSYSAWHHRCWVLDNCPSPDWDKEIQLCDKYLKLDERNFHCWDYRQFIVKRAQVPYSSELEFSTSKIFSNFSNYSSWHYRSILYRNLSPNSDQFKAELDLVENAAFTDPNDTSAWFYQRWILGHNPIVKPQKLLLALCSKDYFIVSLSLPTHIPPKVSLNENLKFRPFQQNSKLSKLWICESEPNLFTSNQIGLQVGTEEYNLKFDTDTDEFKYFEKPEPLGVSFHSEIRPILNQQLDSCRELLQLEPDSKWTLLTSALLLRGLGGLENNDESIKMVTKLIEIDGLRQGYYKDLRSQWITNDYFNKLLTDGTLFTNIYLDDPSITALYHFEYFVGAKHINVASRILYDKLRKRFEEAGISSIQITFQPADKS